MLLGDPGGAVGQVVGESGAERYGSAFGPDGHVLPVGDPETLRVSWGELHLAVGPLELELRNALDRGPREQRPVGRSEEHTSELQSLMRISYAVFCLKKKK